MRRLLVSLVALAVLLVATSAQALECVQSDRQPGVYINGLGSADDQCLTADEYAAMVSVDALLDAGLIDGATDNGDGTTTVDFRPGVSDTVVSDPLDRPVSANPEWEPNAPTVREVLFGVSEHRPI